MFIDKVLHTGLSIIGFPFFILENYRNQKRYVDPPGKLVKKGKRTIHAIDSGPSETPYSVILDAGMGSHSLDWHHVQSEVSKFARVLSMDRAGLGWSSIADLTYYGLEVVEDFRHVLQALRICPPYILVGHSYGSLHMRLFASQYPNEVAALILIDGVHEQRYLPDYWDKKRKQDFARSKWMYRMGYVTSSLGVPKLLKQAAGRRYLTGVDPEVINYTSYQPSAYRAIYQELILTEKTAKQVESSKALPNELPVTIISSNNQDPVWQTHQQLLSKLSNQVSQIQTNHGHSIHLENPKLIVETIKDCLDLSFVKKEEV